MRTIDPTELEFDSSRWTAAIERLTSSRGESASIVESVRESTSMADFIEHYDFGEPEWNGALIILAAELLEEPPTDIVIETWEDLPIIDHDYGRRFHHGNVQVNGSFAANETIWITGNLTVKGAVVAGFLDSFPDLLIGGNLVVGAVSFSGLASVGGDLRAERFVMFEAQGETVVRGDFTTPLVVSDGEAPENLPFAETTNIVDLSALDKPFDALAERLGITTSPKDSDAYDLVQRALESMG